MPHEDGEVPPDLRWRNHDCRRDPDDQVQLWTQIVE